MAELVDAHGSGPCAARCGGSSPLLGTNKQYRSIKKSPQSASLRGFLFWGFGFDVLGAFSPLVSVRQTIVMAHVHKRYFSIKIIKINMINVIFIVGR
jgi:hypothetical protein